MKDRIVNGHQFGKIPRRISWVKQMIEEKIEALDVHWYVTHNSTFVDNPIEIENKLLRKYSTAYGRLPKWNKVI